MSEQLERNKQTVMAFYDVFRQDIWEMRQEMPEKVAFLAHLRLFIHVFFDARIGLLCAPATLVSPL
jgi:hypothetical protein